MHRFWDKTKALDSWTTSTKGMGHGYFWSNIKPNRSHRVAWEQNNGPIPDQLPVLPTLLKQFKSPIGAPETRLSLSLSSVGLTYYLRLSHLRITNHEWSKPGNR